MKDKLTYDQSRHFAIRVNGKKAQILNFLFKTGPDGKKCLVLKTKLRNNLLPECAMGRQCTLEIPDGDETLRFNGTVCAVLDGRKLCEIWLELQS